MPGLTLHPQRTDTAPVDPRITNGSLLRRTLAVAALVALGLAGCSSGDEPEATPSPSPTADAAPELVTTVADPVVRVADPAPVIGGPAVAVDPTLAEKTAAKVAAAVQEAAVAVVEGGGKATLPGDPTLTGPAVELLDILKRKKDPVIDVSITPVADAAPGGALVTVALDARTEKGRKIVIEFSFTVSPEGEPFLALAEVTEGAKAAKDKPDPAPSPRGNGTDAPAGGGTEAATEEAS